MKALLVALALVAAACGGGEVIGGPNATTTTQPEPTQVELLTEARAAWDATRPDEYLFRSDLFCECVSGPWTIHVTASGANVLNGPEEAVPYRTIDEVFDDISRTLGEGRFPVFAEYSGDGVPFSYIFNEPGLASDGGFVLEISTFDEDPDLSQAALQEAELNAELAIWRQAELVSYDYVLSRGCFCPQQFIGPYDGSVRDGVIVLVEFEGKDTMTVDGLKDRPYSEVAPDVDAMFDLVGDAIKQADEVIVAYHPDLGYPTVVSIDWIRDAVDDEIRYQLETVVTFTGTD